MGWNVQVLNLQLITLVVDLAAYYWLVVITLTSLSEPRCTQVGLHVLLDDPAVFRCYDNIHDTIWYSELGASLAILNAGYNLDSLMLRYQVRLEPKPSTDHRMYRLTFA